MAKSQLTFRARNDDGSETTATWIAAENANWTQAVDVNFRVRFEHENTDAGTWRLDTELEYNLNSGGWTSVTGASSVVIASLSSNFADDAVTTDQLTGSAVGFTAGRMDENSGTTTRVDMITNSHSETEWCVQIVSGDVANNDTIELRVTDAGVDTGITYTAVPSITVSEAAGGDIEIFRRRREMIGPF